jgi:hypothetical protein
MPRKPRKDRKYSVCPACGVTFWLPRRRKTCSVECQAQRSSEVRGRAKVPWDDPRAMCSKGHPRGPGSYRWVGDPSTKRFRVCIACERVRDQARHNRKYATDPVYRAKSQIRGRAQSYRRRDKAAAFDRLQDTDQFVIVPREVWDAAIGA